MKKILCLALCLVTILSLVAHVSAAGSITLKNVNVNVAEPVAGEAYSTKATMKEIEDVFLNDAKWEGEFGGDKKNIFIEGNTYKVTVTIFISDLAQGKIVPKSGGLKINSYPIEEYKMYANDKGIEMSITYVCGQKKVVEKKESTSTSSGSSSGSGNTSGGTVIDGNVYTFDPAIEKIYGEFTRYAKYTPYYDCVDKPIEPMHRNDSIQDYMACPPEFKEKARPSELPLVAKGILHIGDSGKQDKVKAYFAPRKSGYARGHLLDDLARMGLFYKGPMSDDSSVNNVASYYYTGSKVDVIAYNDKWVAVWDEGMWTTFIQAHGKCGALYHGRYVKPGIYYYPRENVYILDMKNNSPEPKNTSTGTATCLLAIKTAPESKDYIKSGVYNTNQAFKVTNEEPINGHYQVYYGGGLYYVNATWVNLKKKGVEKPVINYSATLETSESSVSFYDQPGGAGNLIGKGKNGMALEVIDMDSTAEYAKIWFSSRECYVEKAYIKNEKTTVGYRQSMGFKNPVGKLVMDTKWADARADFYMLTADNSLIKAGKLSRNDAVNVYAVERYETYSSSSRNTTHDMVKARYKVIYKGYPGWIIYEDEIETLPFTYYPGEINSAITTGNNQAVVIDGEKYDILAYNIGGNNFFKIRDIAAIFSGSPKTFDIEWDAGAGCINMKGMFDYTPAGGELAKGDGAQKTALESDAMLTYDGVAINATCYNIDGNNYFKLRDITDALDCRVTWNEGTKNIEISTMTPAKEDPDEIKG